MRQQASNGPGSSVESGDLVVRLQVLADLRAAGSLSDQEFATAKARLLNTQ